MTNDETIEQIDSEHAQCLAKCNANPTAHRALRLVMALRELTKQTGTRTTRSQNHILQALSDEELTLVADLLRGGDDLHI